MIGTMESKRVKRNGAALEAVTAWCGGRQCSQGVIVPTATGEVLARFGDVVALIDEGFEVIAKGLSSDGQSSFDVYLNIFDGGQR